MSTIFSLVLQCSELQYNTSQKVILASRIFYRNCTLILVDFPTKNLPSSNGNSNIFIDKRLVTFNILWYTDKIARILIFRQLSVIALLGADNR